MLVKDVQIAQTYFKGQGIFCTILRSAVILLKRGIKALYARKSNRIFLFIIP